MKRKILSIVLTICMVAALLPQASITAKADGTDVFDYSNTPTSDEVFYLRIEIASDGDSFQIPVCGCTAIFTYVSYNWSIDWGDSSSLQTSKGTGRYSGGIEHTYSSSGTYTITIRPNGTVSDGWFRAFGFANTSSGSNESTNKNRLTGIAGIFDDTSMDINNSSRYNYIGYYMFCRCTKLTGANILFDTRATTVGDSFAASMFQECSSLTSLPSGFNLPSGITSVGNSFAAQMFTYCSSLTSLPSGFNLPSGITTAGDSFAASMFSECTSLTGLPSGFNLPSGITTAGDSFAASMFSFCTSLASLPNGFNLPSGITTVGDSYTSQMLTYCTSLTSLPDGFNLPSGITTVGDSFADNMFSSCTSLTAFPDGFNLPSGITTVGDSFADNMFSNCTSLLSLPSGFNLPSGITSAGGAFAKFMFKGNTSLTGLPSGFNFPSGITSAGSLFAYSMFHGCTSLTSFPSDFNFPSGITTGGAFAAYMFCECSSLTSLPSGFNFPNGITTGDGFAAYMFNGCSSLTALPDSFNFPSGITTGDGFASHMFNGCSSLTALPDDFNIPSGITSAGNFFASCMFCGCTSLTALPNGFNLPSGISTNGDGFAFSMFSGCSSLTALPDGFNLPSGITSAGNNFVQYMFSSCRSLTALPDEFNLPSGITTVGTYFAQYMFADCGSLTALPDDFNLPSGITTVGTYFAAQMFNYCTSLEALPDDFNLPSGITTIGTYFAASMFNSCTKLKINSEFRFPALSQAQLDQGDVLTYTFNGITAEQYSDAAAAILSNLPASEDAVYTKIYPSSDMDTFSEAFRNAESWNSIQENWKVTASTFSKAPTAGSVSVSGSAKTGNTLTGIYTFNSESNTAESGSTYKWYTATDSNGNGMTEIFGATNKTYTVSADCVTYYIAFEVTPSDGTDTGTAVMSSWVGPVAAASSDTPSDSHDTSSSNDTSKYLSLIVNGEKNSTVKTKTSIVNGNSTTQVTIDSEKLENALDSAGENATVTIPVTTDCDTVSVAVSGDGIGAMSNSAAVLEIQTAYGTYSLPASEIDLDSIAEQLGADVSEILVTITMGTPLDDTATVVENAAEEGEFSIMVPAVEFHITCSCGGQSVEVDSFSSYVERMIAIPDGVDPEKITTAVVVESGKTVRHVPTYITEIDGVYYAVINSLTNSVYTLIYNPVSFADAAGDWAEAAINDMASREIISGYPDGSFVPDGKITRAEFAAIIAQALGLPEEIGEHKFSDVSDTDWCCGSIETAASYGLMSGYPGGSFGPSDKITREQAMTVVARAMNITGLDAGLSDDEIASLLAEYPDAAEVSAYATSGAAACIKTGIITGKDGTLAPQDAITRAETAVIVQRLLVKSGLINEPKSEPEAEVTDYSLPDNWLFLPETAEYDVDVFYLCPTAYYRFSPDDPVVCGIDNPLMRTNAASAYNRQATAFSTVGNIYAPYYRQPDAVTSLSLSEEDKDQLLCGVTKEDVFSAFDYYIEHYNNGRPFILAGHSLGSNMLLYLLSEYMEEHHDVYKRMIAAYVIGYSVTEDYLAANPHLKFAESADDTGVIISYNTQAPSTADGTNPVIQKGALVINPITWTRDCTMAGAEKNLGSILLHPDGSVILDENGEIKRFMNFADATVDSEKGTLICSTVDVDTWAPGNPVFGKGVFHSFDYPFYYYNLRENAAVRVEAFLCP